MSYSRVENEPETSKVFCPCCPTWEIKRPERCSNTLEYLGLKLYFCTKRCKERFIKNSAAFLT